MSKAVVIKDDSTVAGTPGGESHYNKGFWLYDLIIIVIVAIGLVIIGLINQGIFTSSSTNGQECSNQSSSSVLKQAAMDFNQSQVSRLQQVVTTIKNIPNYQKDPNCLYPIVTYFININDAQNASLYMNELNKVYSPKQGFSSYLGPSINNISTLRSDVSFLANNVRQQQNNVSTFSSPK